MSFHGGTSALATAQAAAAKFAKHSRPPQEPRAEGPCGRAHGAIVVVPASIAQSEFNRYAARRKRAAAAAPAVPDAGDGAAAAPGEWASEPDVAEAHGPTSILAKFDEEEPAVAAAGAKAPLAKRRQSVGEYRIPMRPMSQPELLSARAVDERHRRALPLASLHIRALRLTGISFLETNLRRIASNFVRGAVRAAIGTVMTVAGRPEGGPDAGAPPPPSAGTAALTAVEGVIKKAMDDAGTYLEKYMRSCACESSELSANVDFERRILPSVRLSESQKSCILSVIEWFERLINYTAFARSKDAAVEEFAKTFEKLEEENRVLKDMVFQQAYGPDAPKTINVNRFTGIAARPPVETKDQEINVPETDFPDDELIEFQNRYLLLRRRMQELLEQKDAMVLHDFEDPGEPKVVTFNVSCGSDLPMPNFRSVNTQTAVVDYEREYARYRSTINDLRAKLAAERSESARLLALAEAAKTASVEEATKGLQEKFYERTRECELYERTNQELREQVFRSQVEVHGLREEHTALKRKLDDALAETSKLQEANAELISEKEETEGGLKLTQETLERAESALESHAVSAAEAQRQIEVLMGDNAALRQAEGELRARAARSEAEEERLSKSQAELQAQNALLAEKAGNLHHAVVLLHEEEASQKRTIERTAAKCAELEAAVADGNTRYAALEALMRNMMSYPDVSLGVSSKGDETGGLGVPKELEGGVPDLSRAEGAPRFEIPKTYEDAKAVDKELKDLIQVNNARIALLERKNNEYRSSRLRYGKESGVRPPVSFAPKVPEDLKCLHLGSIQTSAASEMARFQRSLSEPTFSTGSPQRNVASQPEGTERAQSEDASEHAPRKDLKQLEEQAKAAVENIPPDLPPQERMIYPTSFREKVRAKHAHPNLVNRFMYDKSVFDEEAGAAETRYPPQRGTTLHHQQEQAGGAAAAYQWSIGGKIKRRARPQTPGAPFAKAVPTAAPGPKQRPQSAAARIEYTGAAGQKRPSQQRTVLDERGGIERLALTPAPPPWDPSVFSPTAATTRLPGSSSTQGTRAPVWSPHGASSAPSTRQAFARAAAVYLPGSAAGWMSRPRQTAAGAAKRIYGRSNAAASSSRPAREADSSIVVKIHQPGFAR